ncbi:MAG: hypothetical protein IJ199_07335 [Prevotella sp.]|nr:hypothetical protein [Prevotella sp.]
MNLLLKIWYYRYVRSLQWEVSATLFVTVFLIPIFAFPAAYYILFDKIQAHIVNTNLSLVITITALLFQISDFFYKFAFMKGGNDIDDYLKTRPISTWTFCRFMVFENVFAAGNWLFIPTIATGLFLLLDFLTALLSTLLFIAISLMNGLALRTLFYSHSYESKAIVCSAGFLFFPITIILIWKFFGINWWIPFTIYIALCVTMQYFLYRCLSILRNYPDYSRTITKSHTFFAHKTTLPVLATIRSNTLRFQTLIISQTMVLTIILISITVKTHPISPSLFIMALTMGSYTGLYTFGAESNYMDGLWSKPVSIKCLLHNNFLFNTSISVIDAVLLCITEAHNGISQVLLVLSVSLFTIGIINHIYYYNIFVTSRVELFQRSLMRTNRMLNNIIVPLLIFIPLIIELLLSIFLPAYVFCCVISGIGIIGIVSHSYITEKVSKLYIANRYKHFERYRN